MEQKGAPPKITRRQFIREAVTAVGALTTFAAALKGSGNRATTSPAPPTGEAAGPLPKAQEVEKIRSSATIEDILGKDVVEQAISQEESDEYPPQDTEYGPGFKVTSHMEGIDGLPVTEQKGPYFWANGKRGEIQSPSHLIGEASGVAVYDNLEGFGSGANFLCRASLFTANFPNRQCLVLNTDNAFYIHKGAQGEIDSKGSFQPTEVEITIETDEKSFTESLRYDSPQALGNIFIPLGFTPNLPQEVINPKNIVAGGSAIVYREVTEVTATFIEGDKKLTFEFAKATPPKASLTE